MKKTGLSPRRRAYAAAMRGILLLSAAMTLGLVLFLIIFVMAKGLPNLSWKLLSTAPSYLSGDIGILPDILNTVYIVIATVVLVVPLGVGAAIYLTEYAHRSIRKYVYPLLDILAGLPSVIYGVWGTLLIVPWVSKHVAPLFVEFSSGYTVLAGGIVLSVMIIPLLVSLFMEIFDNVSKDLREASLSLGATQWQTIKHVVLRKARPGMIAAVVLALSRTLGETIAVLMVCGNLAIVPGSVLDACYPIPALIANNYGEMLSVPLYDSALMFAAFLLFFVVVVLNLGSRIVLLKVKE